ncbi:hypothetical protein BH20ACT23_BH20ACT23_13910 [soil metagenome]
MPLPAAPSIFLRGDAGVDEARLGPSSYEDPGYRRHSFVGSHVVAGLRRAGHEVRLLVRDPKRIPPALGPLGVADIAHSVGDVLEEASVEIAMDGVDAVLHAASIYSTQRRDVAEVRRTNVRATELVIDAARRRGLDPIVYVSSYGAFLPVHGAMIGPDDPPGEAHWPYARSKADSERVARTLGATCSEETTLSSRSSLGHSGEQQGDGIHSGPCRGRWRVSRGGWSKGSCAGLRPTRAGLALPCLRRP